MPASKEVIDCHSTHTLFFLQVNLPYANLCPSLGTQSGEKPTIKGQEPAGGTGE
jgi:hypothetical protein